MKGFAIIFALLAGMCAASYSIFARLGSTSITPALGAMIVSGVACLVNLAIVIALTMRGETLLFTPRGLGLLLLVGLSAAGVDLFGLLAYSHGLQVTSALLITGVSTGLILLVGFLVLGEPVTWKRLLGISLIVAGVLLLQRSGV